MKASIDASEVWDGEKREETTLEEQNMQDNAGIGSAASSPRSANHDLGGDFVGENQVTLQFTNDIGPAHAMELKEGMRVAIISTDNVTQRVPHLINRIGIIREVPGISMTYSLFKHCFKCFDLFVVYILL